MDFDDHDLIPLLTQTEALATGVRASIEPKVGSGTATLEEQELLGLADELAATLSRLTAV
jgi:hypothetical protein